MFHVQCQAWASMHRLTRFRFSVQGCEQINVMQRQDEVLKVGITTAVVFTLRTSGVSRAMGMCTLTPHFWLNTAWSLQTPSVLVLSSRGSQRIPLVRIADCQRIFFPNFFNDRIYYFQYFIHIYITRCNNQLSTLSSQILHYLKNQFIFSSFQLL